jgi:hypothetical protein
MGKKKNIPSGAGATLPTIRIGSRVRCTEDGVEGRIAWANAVSVKIKWDDGEEVTWKRADLAAKPIQFLDPEPTDAGEQPPVESAPKQAAVDSAAPVVHEQPAVDIPMAEQQAAVAAGEDAVPAASSAEPEATAAATEQPTFTAPTTATQMAESGAEAAAPPPSTDETPAPTTETAATDPLDATLPGGFAIPKRQRKPKTPTEPTMKKLSALDAAAKVLAETDLPMSCKELIGTMAAKGYWTSPGGQTPDATLNAAILREIAIKGDQSRFVKPAPGRFALRPTV